ncbi:MAG: biopolymer transport protein ExbD [Candidatus Deianiraeaceae bacterium]|jgi:biopolymer transport protein ExbD
MIKFHRKKSDWKDDLIVDMTPMIDITFILLIFFILTANVAQHVYPVKLPKADPSFHGEIKDDKPIKVTIFADSTFAIGKKKYSNIGKIKTALLQSITKNNKIIIIPDHNSASGTLISLLTFFEGNNITNVDILIEDHK